MTIATSLLSVLLAGVPVQQGVTRVLATPQSSPCQFRGTLVARVKASPRARAEAEKARGDRLLRAGQRAQAERAYRKAAKLDPTWYEPLEAIGNLLFTRGRYLEAVAVFKKAVRVQPLYYTGLYNIAFSYRKAGKYQQAAEFYRRYLAKKSDDPDGYYGLAATYEALGDLEKAIKFYLAYAEKEKRPSERRYVVKARNKAETLRKRLAATPAPAQAPMSAAATPTNPPAQPPVAKPVSEASNAAADQPAAPRRPPATPVQSPAATSTVATPAHTTAPAAASSRPVAARPAPVPPATSADGERIKKLLASGDRAMAKKSYTQAMKDYFDAVRLDGNNTEALYKLGLVYQATGNSKAAELKWRKVLKIDPGHAGAKRALAKLGAAESATASPQPPRARRPAGRPPLAGTASPASAKPTPQPAPTTSSKSVAAVTAKPTASASAATATAAAGRVRRLIAAGDDQFKQKSFARAIDSYSRASKLAPRNEEALFKLGMAYALSGNYQVAIYKWRQVLKINPSNKSARRNIERAQNMLARGSAAKTPAPQQVVITTAEARRLLADGQADQALQVTKKLLKKQGRDVEVLLLHGQVLLRLKKYAAAKRTFSRAMIADPNRAEPFFGLGEACRLAGDKERARYYFRMYLRSRAEDVDPRKVKRAQAYLGG